MATNTQVCRDRKLISGRKGLVGAENEEWEGIGFAVSFGGN